MFQRRHADEREEDEPEGRSMDAWQQSSNTARSNTLGSKHYGNIYLFATVLTEFLFTSPS